MNWNISVICILICWFVDLLTNLRSQKLPQFCRHAWLNDSPKRLTPKQQEFESHHLFLFRHSALTVALIWLCMFVSRTWHPQHSWLRTSTTAFIRCIQFQMKQSRNNWSSRILVARNMVKNTLLSPYHDYRTSFLRVFHWSFLIRNQILDKKTVSLLTNKNPSLKVCWIASYKNSNKKYDVVMKKCRVNSFEGMQIGKW